jgi:hypothetical protein
MHKSAAFTQIESEIPNLTHDECLRLIERLVRGLRCDSRPTNDTILAEMAADPQIQREMTQIAEEFLPTEMDGLE